MRLTEQQVEAIQATFAKVFGQGEVMLFGSRVFDQKKGGDIDLYLHPTQHTPDAFEKKIAFLVALKQQIGEQKIDAVLSMFAPKELQQEVEHHGVLLCKI
ncbi:MAG: hypothetical protein ACP5D0_07915 [Hydrogenovibrio sp.]